jgi:lipoprotein-anchoring transpeptidase ErfK/SrfK
MYVRHLSQAFALSCIFLLGMCSESFAQGWQSWVDDLFGQRHRGYQGPPRQEQREPLARDPGRKSQPSADQHNGGSRPDIAAVAPPIVEFSYEFPENSIVIDTGGRMLYFVLSNNRAFAYSISVGREGFSWTGTETISRKQDWPDWYPPAEMRERDRHLPEKMSGGLKNPLGAMALYLGNTLYRIHGTNDAKSIGRAASSGCFRMLNSAVLHLASITEIGTTVSVVSSLPGREDIGRAPEQSDQRGSERQAQTLTAQPPPGSSSGQPRDRDEAPDYRALRDFMLSR